MADVAAFSILALTVSLSLSRPAFGPFRIHHSSAALIGAMLTLAFGLIPIDLVFVAGRILLLPVITIVSLMIITLIADRAGLFDVVAQSIARLAGGDGKRLFSYLFFAGTLTGTLFTNDAAILIFTPLVVGLIDEVEGPSWTVANKIPYYFAVLYVANLVGALVISNPINIVVSSMFGIGFAQYAKWMVLPAIVSIIVTFIGLRLVFRKSIPACYAPVSDIRPRVRDRRFMKICCAALGLTLVGFFSEPLTGIPIWLVAFSGAVLLMLLDVCLRGSKMTPIIRGVGWDVIVFVYGIFIVAMGLRSAGLTGKIAALITGLAGNDISAMSYVTGLTAAAWSSVMNNHPTANTMAWVIQDLNLPPVEQQTLVFSALIGGDLGPKMLPIGSLAALLWFRILRDKGVHVPYSLYIKVGVPVTLAAIVLSIMTLNVELWIYRLFLE